MKKKKYHIVRAIPKSDIEFVGGGIPLTHKHMTVHFTGMIQALQYNVVGLNYI